VYWLSVAIASVLLFIYYTELNQQIDPVTSLLNRKSYDYHIANSRKEAVILFLDVDKFKDINDHFGHSFGDYCLAQISLHLKAVYGKYGLCYRYGGDEFCVILHSHLHDVEKINAQFLARLEQVRIFEKRIPTVTIGHTPFHPLDETMEDAINRADSIMYQKRRKQREKP